MEETLKRESFWNELNDAQKIERMHFVVKQQRKTIDYLVRINQDLLFHSHNQAGDVMVNLNKKQNFPRLSDFCINDDFF